MSRGKNKLLVSILILVLILGSLAYYFYNKGPVDVRNETGIKINATELYKTFLSDSIVAKQQYAHKILEVSGVVINVAKNVQAQDIILLKTSTEGASVNCTLEEFIKNIKPGDKVVLKGICIGIGQGAPDLGITADVYLARCYLQQ